jgi:simple sugar transport system permease protein
MKVSSTAVKAYKAIVIIAIVVIGSPVVKDWLKQLKVKLAGRSPAKVEAK